MTEITRYGWTYRFTDLEECEIIPCKEEFKERPLTLFKYYSLTQYSLNGFEQDYLYAPHPFQLNDPFDCHFDLIEIDNPDGLYSMLNSPGMKNPQYTREVIRMHMNSSNRRFMHDVQNTFNLYAFSEYGVLSFTEGPDNLIMWAYYSSHRGFCLEYAYQEFTFKYHGPYQINYQDKLQRCPISVGPAAFFYQTNIKKKFWSHENEWRIIAENTDSMRLELKDIEMGEQVKGRPRHFKYDVACIKSITLGYNFFHWEKELKAIGEAKYEIVFPLDDPRIPLLQKCLSASIEIYYIWPIIRLFMVKRVLARIIFINDHTLQMDLLPIDPSLNRK